MTDFWSNPPEITEVSALKVNYRLAANIFLSNPSAKNRDTLLSAAKLVDSCVRDSDEEKCSAEEYSERICALVAKDRALFNNWLDEHYNTRMSTWDIWMASRLANRGGS